MWWVESQKRPPTSHWDSLMAEVGCMVVEVSCMVGGKPEKTTNKSLGLIGGRGGPCGEWKPERPPTSHWGLLVAEVGHVVGGKPETPTNKSPGLVGGGGGGVVMEMPCSNVGGHGDGCALVVVVSSHHCQYLDILLVKSKKKRNKKIKTYLLPRDVNI